MFYQILFFILTRGLSSLGEILATPGPAQQPEAGTRPRSWKRALRKMEECWGRLGEICGKGWWNAGRRLAEGQEKAGRGLGQIWQLAAKTGRGENKPFVK